MTVDELRSCTMRAVRSKDTKPQLLVRRLIHSLRFRFRLHRKYLPESPDPAFPGRRKVIFVHGCFWHGHDCGRGNRRPKTNADYWLATVERNRLRDELALELLSQAGWSALAIWEGDLKEPGPLACSLQAFLKRDAKQGS